MKPQQHSMKKKSKIPPIDTKNYRDDVTRTRITNQSTNNLIPPEIKIVKDKDSLWTLGAYVGNNNEMSVQWKTILKMQAKIIRNWSRINLLTKGKKLVLKALIQSKTIYLATANEMPKDIPKRMTNQMKSFLWDRKRPLMNWTDIAEPRNNGELNMLDIEAYIEAIQIMWLKKYLVPLSKRPLWAFVTNQIVFKFVQKAPEVKERNKIN